MSFLMNKARIDFFVSVLNIKNQMPTPVIISPESLALIKVDGPSYLRLSKDPKYRQAIANAVKINEQHIAGMNWNTLSKMTTAARITMHAKCSRCFLLPPNSRDNPTDKPKYPICTAHSADLCRPDCYGIASAYRRALIVWKRTGRKEHKNVLEKAKHLLETQCSLTPQVQMG